MILFIMTSLHENIFPLDNLSYATILSSIILLATISFHSSVIGGFVFDDVEAVVNNADIKLTTPLSNLFVNDFWGTRITHNSSHKSYRPLTILSYRLNVLASNGLLISFQFRLVNLLLYIVVCCLSFILLRRVCSKVCCNQISLVAGVLFTVHPVHSECVAPVVGRADLLCTIFMISSLLIYSSSWNRSESLLRNMYCTLMTVLFAAIAMFTKEQGITILGICLIYDILITHKLHPKEFIQYKNWPAIKSTTHIMRYLILISSAIMLLIMRWWIMGGTVPVFQKVDNPASFMDSIYLRVVNYIYIYALNLWLLICPEWLCFDWSMGCVPLIESASDIRLVFVILFTSVFGHLVYTLLNKPTDAARIQLMAMSFILLPFLPASNIFLRVGFVIAERTLLFPSLGFCLLIAFGIQRLAQHTKQKPLICVTVLLIIVYCGRSHVRTTQWSSERDLFVSALNVCPLNAKVHYNLAKTATNINEAIIHYKEALRLNPSYEQAMNNLANILKDDGKLKDAELLLRQSIKIRPDFAAAWMNLGIVLAHRKKLSEAEECYKNAIRHRRKYPACYYNLGNLYLELKNHAKAYDSWRQATLLEPTHHAAWNNWIIMLDSLGKHEEACSVGLQALKYLPNSPAVYFNIANAKGKLNLFVDAEKYFKTAIKLKSDNPIYYINLGVLYHHWKKFGLAKKMYRKALQLDPDLESAKKNLLLLET